MKKYILNTYEAIIDDMHFEAIGTSLDDAQVNLKEWLDKYTNGYKLVKFRFKRNGL
jgi:hypothetical protein